MLASASNDIKVLSTADNFKVCSQFEPSIFGKIPSFSWCNDNSYLAIAQENQNPLILSTKEHGDIYVIHEIEAVKNTTTVAFKHNTKKNLAIGNSNGELVVYDTRLREIERNYPKCSFEIKLVEYNYNDVQLALSCSDSFIIYYEGEDESANEFKLSSACTCLKYHPRYFNFLAVGCHDGSVTIYDTEAAAQVNCYTDHNNSVTGIAITNTGDGLISAGKDYKICIYNNCSGKLEYRISLNHPINSIDLFGDDNLLAAGLDDGSIYLYDMRKYTEPLNLSKVHNTPVNKVKFENTFMEFEYNDTDNNFNNANHCEQECISCNSSTSKNQIKDNNSLSDSKNISEDGDLKTYDILYESIKRDLMKNISHEIREMENQLNEHCSKFQQFINHEFESLHEAVNKRWQIFTNGDPEEIADAINSFTEWKTKHSH